MNPIIFENPLNEIESPSDVLKCPADQETEIPATVRALEKFLDRTIEINPLGEIPQKDLYFRYQKYCLTFTQPVMSRRAFGPKVRKYCQYKQNIVLEKHISQIGPIFLGIQFAVRPDQPEIEQAIGVLSLLTKSTIDLTILNKVRELLVIFEEKRLLQV